MKKILMTIVAMSTIIFTACSKTEKVTPSYDKGINIIPLPMSLIQGKGNFELKSNTQIVASDSASKTIAEYFATTIRQSTGYPVQVVKEGSNDGNITLSINPNLELNDEGYTLTSTAKDVQVVGKTAQGLFYGMQSLMQLLPAEIESRHEVDSIFWQLPAVTIKDQPVFPYRGMLIDVCRHFLTVDQLKKHIDVLALFKINRLHLHLTEDQGWRIEIKKYPRLTQIGSKRIEGDSTEYGGYYTQDDIKDIVKYAQDRFITIIPEIEMPGHAMAAITAYPELATNPNKDYKVRNIWGVESDVYDASNEKVYQFVSDVFDEVAPLFPSKYIHIGGDECPKISWKNSPKCQAFMRKNGLKNEEELQSYFIKRAEKIAEAHGKYIIGWDEILEGGLPAAATVMSWRGEQGGIIASNAGHDVIMTPGSGGLYIDHYQGDPKVEPLAICCYAPLEKTYSYNPIPKDIKPENRHHILGSQGNLWAEYLYTPELYNYRAYPRMLAIAELTWTPLDRKNFEDFCRRLNNAYVRLDELGVNYHIPIPEQPNGSCDNISFIDSTKLELKTTRPMTIIYSIGEDSLSPSSKVYTEPIVIKDNMVINTASVLPSGKLSIVRHIKFTKSQYDKPAISLEDSTKLKHGLKVERSEGNYSSTSQLEKSTNWISSTIKSLSQIIDKRRDKSTEVGEGVIATGYIKIVEAGVYEFSTNYEQLFIDGKLVVDNSGLINKFSRKNSTIALDKGFHSIKIVYFDVIRGGYPSYWDNGQIYYRLWGTDKLEPISNSMLYFN